MEILNGKINTMAGTVYRNGFVLTNGRRILAVGAMEDYEETVRAMDEETLAAVRDRRIRADGAWVLPGFIEAHCHVGIIEEKRGIVGDDCNEGTKPLTPELRAIDAVNPMDPAFHDALKAGITSVMTGPGSTNVVGGQFVFMKTHGRRADQMKVLEPAAMKIAFGENPKSNFGKQNISPSSRMAIAGMLREELFQARAYRAQKMAEKAGNAPACAKDFRMEAWMPVLEKKIPLKAHVHRADDILTAIRIAEEFDLELTLDHCTEGHLIAEEIAKSGFPAIVGPSLTARSKIEVENMSFKTVGILQRAGVLTAITTDHPVTLIQHLPLCAGLAVKNGLPPKEGLAAITIHAAKICRLAGRVGSLEPGKDADIAVFDGNPMEIFTNTLYTIVDGEVVYDRERDG